MKIVITSLFILVHMSFTTGVLNAQTQITYGANSPAILSGEASSVHYKPRSKLESDTSTPSIQKNVSEIPSISKQAPGIPSSKHPNRFFSSRILYALVPIFLIAILYAYWRVTYKSIKWAIQKKAPQNKVFPKKLVKKTYKKN